VPDPDPALPAGYAQAVCTGTYGPASWTNILYFGILDPGTNTDLVVAGDVGAAAAALYDKLGFAHFVDAWEHQTVKVIYRPLEGDMVKTATVADAVGTDSGDGESAQVAYLINWITSDYRRGGKPRTYICGVPVEATADSATLDTDWRGSMNSGLADWIAQIASGDDLPGATTLELVEMSFIDGGVARDPALAFPVGGGLVNHVVATQRRRVDRLR
jgi:hypothetical protein